mgnify:CR=1 FL=1
MPETPEFHIANKSTKFQRLQSFENFSRIVASIRTFFRKSIHSQPVFMGLAKN